MVPTHLLLRPLPKCSPAVCPSAVPPQLHTLQGHSNWVRTVAFSPLSTKIISGSVRSCY